MMIDLDQNATTPLDPRVLEAMRPYFLAGGNPESRHALGRAARRGLELARERVAALLNAETAEVIFTSGGTESNNLAIFGMAGLDRGPGHILTSPIEHPSVSEPLLQLRKSGFEVTEVDVDREGLVNLEATADLIRFDTRFVTLILANNETGAIQPVTRLAAIARERGLPTHTDAVQAIGRIPVDFKALGVSTLAASAHKFHGPVGVGLLLVRKGTPFQARGFGGGQQSGRRPGTQPVALAVGLAEALTCWKSESETRAIRWTTFRDHLENALIFQFGADAVVRNGPHQESVRLPQTINLAFPGLDGDALLIQLDLAGVAVSLGSACSSGSTQPSPTLVAMKVPGNRLRSSLRISFGAFTTEDEITLAIQRITNAVERIRSASEVLDFPS